MTKGTKTISEENILQSVDALEMKQLIGAMALNLIKQKEL